SCARAGAQPASRPKANVLMSTAAMIRLRMLAPLGPVAGPAPPWEIYHAAPGKTCLGFHFRGALVPGAAQPERAGRSDALLARDRSKHRSLERSRLKAGTSRQTGR